MFGIVNNSKFYCNCSEWSLILLTVFLIYSACTEQNERICVERLPSVENWSDTTEFVRMEYYEGKILDHTTGSSEVYSVHFDTNNNNDYFDVGIDLITIIPFKIDTLRLTFMDTLRSSQLYRVNGEIYAFEDQHLSPRAYDPDQHKSKTVFTNLHHFDYIDLNDEIQNYDVDSNEFTYLYYWSPRCSPCLAQLPILAQYVPTGCVKIIALADQQYCEEVKEYIEQEQIDYTIGIITQDFMDYTGIDVYSTSYLLSNDGKVVTKNPNIFQIAQLCQQ